MPPPVLDRLIVEPPLPPVPLEWLPELVESRLAGHALNAMPAHTNAHEVQAKPYRMTRMLTRPLHVARPSNPREAMLTDLVVAATAAWLDRR